MSDVLARLDGIVRRFGTVTALDGADLELRAGQVHGVLGENGAGKSTLLNILGGMLPPHAGAITLSGEPVTVHSPREAWARGIGLVHQHFKLVPRLTVLENLALGRRTASRGWRLPLVDVEARARDIMGSTGFDVPLHVHIEELGVGERQRVEVLKALLREPRLLVLDEPTAVLAPAEVDGLFTLLRSLADDGRGVVLVAHKLDEVLSVADHVTVLQSGRTVLSAPRHEVDAPVLTRAMVGQDLPSSPERAPRAERADVVASLEDVGDAVGRRRQALIDVSLELRRGEIVGVAGVDGNGQHELAHVLSGRRVPATGQVRLPAGIGFIPQDRTSEGLALGFDLTENVALSLHRQARFRSGMALAWPDIDSAAETLRSDFDIQAADTRVVAGALSGGNQQRLVVGRELPAATDLLVAENPTRGLDVVATRFVRDRIRELVSSDDAPAVALISTDLDEVLALSDRIFAMVRGRLIPVPAGARTRAGVGALMLSGGAEASVDVE